MAGSLPIGNVLHDDLGRVLGVRPDDGEAAAGVEATRGEVGLDHLEARVAQDYVRRLDIRTPSIDKVTRYLSGGNQQKIIIGKWLFRDARIMGGDSADILVRDGVIAEIGRGVDASGARVIDAAGKTVAPGFVAVDSGLAGTEVGSVRGTNELRNSANTLSAAFDISYGLDPWSFTLPVARLGGVTRAVVVPQHPGSSGGHVHEHDTAGAGEGDDSVNFPFR